MALPVWAGAKAAAEAARVARIAVFMVASVKRIKSMSGVWSGELFVSEKIRQLANDLDMARWN